MKKSSIKPLKILLAVSAAAYIYFEMSNNPMPLYKVSDYDLEIIFNTLAVFVLTLFFENKYKILGKIYENKQKWYLLVSGLITVFFIIKKQDYYVTSYIMMGDATNPIKRFDMLKDFIFLLSASSFFIFAIVYAVVSRYKIILDFIKSQIAKANVIERRYFCISVVIFSAFIIYFYSISDVMVEFKFDIIFTFDTSEEIKRDAFFNIFGMGANVRRPLFALFTIPFAVLAKIVALPFFFLPKAYVVILQIMQAAALSLTAVLLSRMVGVKDNFSKIMFLILYSISYPVLLFSFCFEQYVPPTFLIILTFYLWFYANKKSNVIAALSSGSILTSCLIVPFITFEKNIKNWFRSMFKIIAVFMVMLVFCGELYILTLGIGDTVSRLSQFADIGLNSKSPVGYNKFDQLTRFIGYCFTAPETIVGAYFNNIISFQLAEPRISIIGVILLALCLVSIVVNRKATFAKICGLWALFAVIIMYVIGWGSPENGMIIYSLYFGWAFFALAFMLFEKLFSKLKPVKYIAYATAAAVMLFLNINGIVELTKFAVEYFPAK